MLKLVDVEIYLVQVTLIKIELFQKQFYQLPKKSKIKNKIFRKTKKSLSFNMLINFKSLLYEMNKLKYNNSTLIYNVGSKDNFQLFMIFLMKEEKKPIILNKSKKELKFPKT